MSRTEVGEVAVSALACPPQKTPDRAWIGHLGRRMRPPRHSERPDPVLYIFTCITPTCIPVQQIDRVLH